MHVCAVYEKRSNLQHFPNIITWYFHWHFTTIPQKGGHSSKLLTDISAAPHYLQFSSDAANNEHNMSSQDPPLIAIAGKPIYMKRITVQWGSHFQLPERVWHQALHCSKIKPLSMESQLLPEDIIRLTLFLARNLASSTHSLSPEYEPSYWHALNIKRRMKMYRWLCATYCRKTNSSLKTSKDKLE
jgi:hypothetical protein